MIPPRSASLLALPLLLGSATLALAEEARLTVDERTAIESRIDALNNELESLSQQLAEDERQARDEASAPEARLAAEIEHDLEVVEERRQLERESSLNPFAITTHRRNYLLPLSYNRNPDSEGFDSGGSAPDRAEVKFQFSAKFNLVEDLFVDNGDLYFAYTQRSWWQAYNADSSSPFRETNYEPEVYLDFDNRWSLLGWTNINNRVAFNHQSNGRSNAHSRSWNRVILESTFINGDWAFSLAPHWRVPESDGDDDNPDIERYMGYGDVTLAHRFGDQELSLLWRGNPSAGHMGTQLDYSWPLFGNIRGHVQYYYGFGESMIDYDERSHRLGIGFSLNPLFSGSGMSR
ncbi:phospholipase [Halomonas heilongjiangensis]|uniref:Phospholipase A1 n=2 Tax=Halomonas heilongjiangensis TaxID=1387883 RepID=A0A2N7TPT2_9GAMM|nr:phospholipase [Halomonas heilongjiangensis]PXX87776.1 phospholipase [Halomonas heilongjiangensis]